MIAAPFDVSGIFIEVCGPKIRLVIYVIIDETEFEKSWQVAQSGGDQDAHHETTGRWLQMKQDPNKRLTINLSVACLSRLSGGLTVTTTQ